MGDSSIFETITDGNWCSANKGGTFPLTSGYHDICDKYDKIIQNHRETLTNISNKMKHRDKRRMVVDCAEERYYFEPEFTNDDIILSILNYLDYNDIITLCIISEKFTTKYWQNNNDNTGDDHYVWRMLYLRDISNTLSGRIKFKSDVGEISIKRKYINLMAMYYVELGYHISSRDVTKRVFSEKNFNIMKILKRCRADKLLVRILSNYCKIYEFTCISSNNFLGILFVANNTKLIYSLIEMHNISSNDCMTRAIRYGNMEVVENLIALGYSDQRLILNAAILYGRKNIIHRMLPTEVLYNKAALYDFLQKYADEEYVDRIGMVELMISQGADDIEQIVKLSVIGGYVDILQYLINKGYNNYNKIVSLTLSEKSIRKVDVINLMIANGINNFDDIMIRASELGLFDVVQLMLENGAKNVQEAALRLINYSNRYKNSYDDIRYVDTLELLLDHGADDYEVFMNCAISKNRNDLYEVLLCHHIYNIPTLILKEYIHRVDGRHIFQIYLKYASRSYIIDELHNYHIQLVTSLDPLSKDLESIIARLTSE